jgi:hypothetical protein
MHTASPAFDLCIYPKLLRSLPCVQRSASLAALVRSKNLFNCRGHSFFHFFSFLIKQCVLIDELFPFPSKRKILLFYERNTFSLSVRFGVRTRRSKDCELIAILERILTDALYAIGNSNARKVSATGNCPFSNTRHAVRDFDAFEFRATTECTSANACDATICRDGACATSSEQAFGFSFD